MSHSSCCCCCRLHPRRTTPTGRSLSMAVSNLLDWKPSIQFYRLCPHSASETLFQYSYYHHFVIRSKKNLSSRGTCLLLLLLFFFKTLKRFFKFLFHLNKPAMKILCFVCGYRTSNISPACLAAGRFVSLASLTAALLRMVCRPIFQNVPTIIL